MSPVLWVVFYFIAVIFHIFFSLVVCFPVVGLLLFCLFVMHLLFCFLLVPFFIFFRVYVFAVVALSIVKVVMLFSDVPDNAGLPAGLPVITVVQLMLSDPPGSFF